MVGVPDFPNLIDRERAVIPKSIDSIDKSIHVLFATFQSQAPDPGLGGLIIWGGISQFCAFNIYLNLFLAKCRVLLWQ